MPELPLSDDTDTISLPPVPAGLTGKSYAEPGTNLVRAINNLSDAIAHFQQDAPTCPNCGHVAVRNGACYKCLNCGESLGCS